MRDIYRDNDDRFRLFCPDETNSNRLGAVFEVSDRMFAETVYPEDVSLSRDGRVMEVLSEHNCHGWLEGYTLTGRHGPVRDVRGVRDGERVSQTSSTRSGCRRPSTSTGASRYRASTSPATSTAWRNDHNGFSHQGPGLLQNVITTRGNIGRVYLHPPDANSLLSVADHCFRSRSYVNVIVVDKQPQLQWMTIDEAVEHCARGAGVWEWAGTDDGSADPDIVLACAGDVVTMETIAAAEILKKHMPHFRTRVVNVVDLVALPRRKDHPHGMDETLFNELFTDHVDVVFAFHGYPGAIHQLVHGRPDADRFRVRSFIEEGTTTPRSTWSCATAVSRYHLVMDAINNARRTPPGARASSRRGARRSWTSTRRTSSSTSRTCSRCATGRSVTALSDAGGDHVLVVNAGSSSVEIRRPGPCVRVAGSHRPGQRPRRRS